MSEPGAQTASPNQETPVTTIALGDEQPAPQLTEEASGASVSTTSITPAVTSTTSP